MIHKESFVRNVGINGSMYKNFCELNLSCVYNVRLIDLQGPEAVLPPQFTLAIITLTLTKHSLTFTAHAIEEKSVISFTAFSFPSFNDFFICALGIK